jgi:hypothetical protein
MRPTTWKCARSWLLLVCVAGVAGCTVLSDFDVQECTSHADCDLLVGSVSRCESGRCLSGCNDNSHCAAVDLRFPVCERRGGACVSLTGLTGGCVASGYEERALGALTLDGIDVLVAFAATPRSSTWLSFELAVTEWNEARRSSGFEPSRPLVLLLCDDAEQSVSATVPRVLGEIGVRALLAPGDEAALRALLEPIRESRSVLVLSPHGSSIGAASGVSRESVWFLGASDSATLPAYEQTLGRAVTSARARAPDPSSFQLASVVGDGSEDEALWNAVRPLLEVDGRDADELVIEDRLRIVRPPPERRFDPTHGLERLLDPTPQLVLLFMGPREDPAELDAATIIQQVEASVAARGAAPPLYILGPRSLEDVALHSSVARQPALRSRIIGMRADPGPDARLGAELEARFVAAYPAAASSAAVSHPNASAYDAVYLLALASFAAQRGGAESAGDVLAGLLRVVAGAPSVPIDVGPGQERSRRALQLLEEGVSLQLNGASGPVQFDDARTRLGAPPPYVVGADGLPRDVDPANVFDAIAETTN